MKHVLQTVLVAALLAAGAASAPAYAGGSSVHFGFGFGFPVYPAPYYYPPPAYYYPPPVYVQPPPVYVEPPQAAAPAAPPPQAQAAPQDQYWYYCPDSKTYYPYVQTCTSAWQRVRPQPPGT